MADTLRLESDWRSKVCKVCDMLRALCELGCREFNGGKTVIRLKIVDPENWRLGLKVSESQKRFVADDMRLLARAYA